MNSQIIRQEDNSKIAQASHTHNYFVEMERNKLLSKGSDLGKMWGHPPSRKVNGG